jgi:hypothetical protein
MSWWISRTGAGGRRELWAVDVDPLLAMVLLALPLAVLLSGGLLSVSLLVLGFICLVVSKMSLFRRGVWFSWGPRLMSARNATIYKIGYSLVGFGALLRLALRV